MITKVNKKKSLDELGKPKLEKRSTPKPGDARKWHDERRAAKSIDSITLMEREEAIAQFCKAAPTEVAAAVAAEDLPRATIGLVESLVINRVRGPFHDQPPGMATLHGLADGLMVSYGDRRSVIPWGELAQDLRDDAGEPDGDAVVDVEAEAFHDQFDDSAAQRPKKSKPTKKAMMLDILSEPAISPAPDSGEPTARSIELKLIDPNPFQPRKEFDAAALEELARSLAAEGLIQRIQLRPDGQGRYQIVDGERRFRAATIAGWTQIRADVSHLTDEQMAKRALVANLERKDLNAIEEAVAFKELLEKFGYTQQRLGKEFHVSQGQVANRLRLLSLPDDWRQRIISQEIPPTHARHLVPYAHEPAVLERVNFRCGKKVGSVEEFERAVLNSVIESSRPLSGYYYDDKRGGRDVAFKATPAQLADLRVIEIEQQWGGKQKRAMNVALWEELQTAGEQRRAEREENKISKATSSGRKNQQPKKSAKSKADQERLFARRLFSWRVNWTRYLCARALAGKPDKTDTPTAKHAPLKLVLWCAFSMQCDGEPSYSGTVNSFNRRDDDVLAPVLVARKLKQKKDVWDALSQEEPQLLSDLCRDVARQLLFDDKNGPQEFLPPDVVLNLADDLAIDAAAAWRHELAGPLSEQYFELHTKDQLVALGTELGVYIEPGKPRSVSVKKLLECVETKKRLPAEILKAKAVR